MLHLGINSLYADILTECFHVQQLQGVTQPSESGFSHYVSLNENWW